MKSCAIEWDVRTGRPLEWSAGAGEMFKGYPASEVHALLADLRADVAMLPCDRLCAVVGGYEYDCNCARGRVLARIDKEVGR